MALKNSLLRGVYAELSNGFKSAPGLSHSCILVEFPGQMRVETSLPPSDPQSLGRLQEAQTGL